MNKESILILILGHPASGKSAGIRGLNPKTTYLIKVIDRKLPFKEGKEFNKENKNLTVTQDYAKLSQLLVALYKQEHIEDIVIDDSQYLMAEEMMRRSKEKGYDKFVDIARNFHELVTLAKSIKGKNIWFLHHIDDTTDRIKMKTVGKMLDAQIGMEGYFDIILQAKVVDGNYILKTKKTDIDELVRAPIGMFEVDSIENDFKIVKEIIKKYDE